MPIIIEKEKSGSLVNILLIALLVIVMAVATYFVFFSGAPIIDNFSSSEFKNATKIQQINFDASAIFNSPVRALLTTTIALPPEGSFGRDNPYLPITPAVPPPGATTSTTTTTSTSTTRTTSTSTGTSTTSTGTAR